MVFLILFAQNPVFLGKIRNRIFLHMVKISIIRLKQVDRLEDADLNIFCE